MDEQRFAALTGEFLELVKKTHTLRGTTLIVAPIENGWSATPVHEDGTVGEPVRGYLELTQARGELEAIAVVVGPSGRMVWWQRKKQDRPKIRTAARYFQDQIYAAYRVVHEKRMPQHKALAKEEIGDVPPGVTLERKADDFYTLQFYARDPLTKDQAKAIIDVIREQTK